MLHPPHLHCRLQSDHGEYSSLPDSFFRGVICLAVVLVLGLGVVVVVVVVVGCVVVVVFFCVVVVGDVVGFGVGFTDDVRPEPALGEGFFVFSATTGRKRTIQVCRYR